MTTPRPRYREDPEWQVAQALYISGGDNDNPSQIIMARIEAALVMLEIETRLRPEP